MIKIAVAVLCLATITMEQTKTTNLYAAIQNQNQTYFSYLPYIFTCNYTQQSMYPGSAVLKPLTDQLFYQYISYQDSVFYWAPVEHGLSIMVLLYQQVTSYHGFILYNSKIRNFRRQIILYNISQTNLTFFYAQPYINVQQMFLTLDIVKTVPIDLNFQCFQLVKTCPYVNNSNFVFLGNDTYLFVCGHYGLGFTFSPNKNLKYHMISFSQMPLGIYQLAPNGYILSDPFGTPKQQWNCLLYTQDLQQAETQLYLLTFNQDFTSFDYIPLKQREPEINLLINRIWGYQIRKQVSRWMDLFSTFNMSQSAYFPGDVVSVFVSDRENIFVESATSSGINYLCVFNNRGQLYWNISYKGSIIYYGNKQTFIYNNEEDRIYLLEVSRPIDMINVSNFANESVPDTFSDWNTSIQCQQQNITLLYKILWTTELYPTALIVYLNSTPIYTTDAIYGFEVDDKFLVIGPDFHLIVNPPPNLQAIVIDYSTIVINQQAIGIVDIQVSSGSFANFIVATNTTIYLINSNNRIRVLTVQPCGFNSISQIQRIGTISFLITNDNNEKCACSLDFSQCHLINQTQAYSQMIRTMGENIPISGSVLQSYLKRNNDIYYNEKLYIKKNLFGLIKQGYYVSILQNNTVILFDVKNNKVLDTVYMKCNSKNSTNGDIYIRQFFDPFLILFCEQEETISQFVIRQNLIIFQRLIPLYRFKTRKGQKTFFPASTYIFIAVDPVVVIYPQQQNCCVLRLNPCVYTVSVIQQVIDAQSIIGVGNYRNVDLALLKNSQGQKQCIIKAYFPNTWITLNQTNSTQIVSNKQKVPIVFESPKYNFGASFEIFITFNLTEVNINLTKNLKNVQNINQAKFNLSESPILGPSFLSETVSYNMNHFICGPIFNSFFFRAVENMSNLEIIQQQVLTKSKILGNIGTEFLQIINPSKWNIVNSTLNYLILVVSVQKLFVYDKLLNGVQMAPITNFTLPQKRCLYYLYTAINETAAELMSNCEGINYNFRSPLLTINYDPQSNNSFSSSYEWITMPLALRQIYTIVRPNDTTLVIGILEGPMNAATGRLYLCDGNSCSPLYISTHFTFLINYAAHYDSNMYLIMSIDAYTIQVFINPEVQPNTTQIDCNYTFNYTNYVDEPYCSVIKILNSTLTYSYITLSCSNFYYYMKLIFTPVKNITILQKFARYSQCDLYDQFKPVVITNNSGLQVLFAQCRQNDFTFKLQAYQTINSSSPVIYTGYMQIFTMNGPLGPNCSNSSLSPLKIIPLSSGMNSPLYISYTVGSSIYKFIYSQINGILIDNFINFQPTVTIQYHPISIQQELNLPEIKMFVMNEFHQIYRYIPTTLVSPKKKANYLNIIVFVIFIIANAVTILFMICYYCQNNDANKNLLAKMRGRNSTLNGLDQNELQYEDNMKKVYEIMSREREATATAKKSSINRPSQIQMFFIKNK